MSTSTSTDRSIDVLNSLLRGEISAQEAYAKALALTDDMTDGEVAELRRVAAEHTRAAEAIRTEVFRLGGVPAGNGGAWGAFARAFQSSANLLGASAAIASLGEGEDHGLREYEEALVSATVPTRTLLAGTLIPSQREHAAALLAIGVARRSGGTGAPS